VAKTVICFSGASDGTYMREVAATAAERLGLPVADEEIILQAASGADVDPAVVADVERRRSFVDRVLGGMAASADTGSLALSVTGSYSTVGPESERLRELIRQAIDETAARGDVVIVAHGATHALAASPDVLRVLVTASPETRRDRLVTESGLSEKEASRAVDANDAARADYLRRFYGVKQELPVHYDVVLNTDRLTAEQAAALVVLAAAH
jgi:cytidylate kinase